MESDGLHTTIRQRRQSKMKAIMNKIEKATSMFLTRLEKAGVDTDSLSLNIHYDDGENKFRCGDRKIVCLPVRDNETVKCILPGESELTECFIYEVSMHYGHEGGVRFNCLLPNRNHEDFSFGLSDIGKTVFIDMKNAPTQ
jgi:hypothetical protein